jgi:hypothetical protein
MKRLRFLSSFFVILMVFTIRPSVYAADDVVLNPGTISGSVALTGYQITSVTLHAIDTNKIYSATVTESVPAGASSIGYTLTVEGDNDYYVIADVTVQDANYTRVLIPPSSPVTVAIGADVPHDLMMEPAIISGTISTGSAANTITDYSVYAYLNLPEFDQVYASSTYAYGLSAPGDVGTDYTLLVAPGTVYYYVRAYIGIDGLSYNIYDYDVNSPAAGVVLDRDYIVDVSAATISGYALLDGVDVTSASVYGYSWSPPPTRYSNTNIPDVSTGIYSLAVDEGLWRLYPRFSFNLPDADPDLSGLTGWLNLPYSPEINVLAGDELTLDFDVVPGFIPGTLALWGANTNFAWAQVGAYGASGGSTYSRVDPDTGKFMFVASPGDWYTDSYQYMYFDYPENSDTYLSSSVYQYNYNNIDKLETLETVVADQTNSPIELSYGTITVLRYFYVAGDGVLKSPYIKATRSESPFSTAYGYGSPFETTEGQAIVTLLLPGDYSLEAFATVNGSNTEFGTVNISVEEGDVVVIGGTSRPTIKVTNPTNGETICGNTVTVEGTATDDVGVATITINGEAVDFVSTSNPDDPNEVSFSAEVILTLDAANDITVTVADVDETDPISLSMTVYSDRCGPDEIEVALDVKPGSCPNPLNVKSKGVLPVAILGTAELDVATVDINSVNILGVAPVRNEYEDVATPFYSFFIGKQDKLDCTEAGADGYNDLTLKFDRQQLVEALEAGSSVADGDVITLQLNGNLLEEFGGTPIVGEDVIVILNKDD